MSLATKCFTVKVTQPLTLNQYYIHIPGLSTASMLCEAASLPIEQIEETQIYYRGQKITIPGKKKVPGKWQFKVVETIFGSLFVELYVKQLRQFRSYHVDMANALKEDSPIFKIHKFDIDVSLSPISQALMTGGNDAYDLVDLTSMGYSGLEAASKTNKTAAAILNKVDYYKEKTASITDAISSAIKSIAALSKVVSITLKNCWISSFEPLNLNAASATDPVEWNVSVVYDWIKVNNNLVSLKSDD